MVLLILTKIRQTRKLESIHEYHFVERKNKGWKTRVWEDSSLCQETSTKNGRQEFNPWKGGGGIMWDISFPIWQISAKEYA